VKKIQVIWTDESLSDLEVIYDFITERSPESAKKVIQSILSRTHQLEIFPQSGSPQKTELMANREYRYLVEGNYKIIYSLDDKVLYVEAVVDTRQNPTKLKV
jgi:plasmid stabilization system protein ParE